ncbi:MAG: methyltransferase domain-containing protein [Candidatus Eremiobacterota bacterium]
MTADSGSPARPSKVRAYLEGFWGTWLLHVGRELGLFEALQRQRLTAEELASRLGYEPGYTEVWCRAAHAYEFLEGSQSEGYIVSQDSEALAPGLGAWVNTYIQVTQRVYESLEAVFRGKAFPEPSLSLRMLLADGLRTSYAWLWEHQVSQVPDLQARFQTGGRLVEFGCGCGYGLEELRKRYPQVEVTGIEADYECAREAERATRAVIVVGTAEECRYEDRFDVAVFHRSLSLMEDPAAALQRAVLALKKGGFLIVSSDAQLPAEEDRRRALEPRLRLGERFFYQMFLAPDSLRNFTADDIIAWAEAGGAPLLAALPGSEQGSAAFVFQRAGKK